MAVISVRELYNKVNDLAKKHHAGYNSAEEFNRKLKTTEIGLLEYFQMQDEKDQNVTDHLAPFRKYEPALPIVEVQASYGVVELPEDYAHKSAVGMVYKQNPKDCADGTIVTPYPCWYRRTNEVNTLLTDPIAKPILSEKVNRFYHCFRNNEIHVFPKELKAIELTYLRYPEFGKIAFSPSVVNGEDVLTYDASNSVDLEWNDITFKYFEMILLMELGVELKEPFLVQYSQMQKQDGVLKPVG